MVLCQVLVKGPRGDRNQRESREAEKWHQWDEINFLCTTRLFFKNSYLKKNIRLYAQVFIQFAHIPYSLNSSRKSSSQEKPSSKNSSLMEVLREVFLGGLMCFQCVIAGTQCFPVRVFCIKLPCHKTRTAGAVSLHQLISFLWTPCARIVNGC